MGNHSRNFSPNSAASITQKSQSVTARAEPQYGQFSHTLDKRLGGAGVDAALVGA